MTLVLENQRYAISVYLNQIIMRLIVKRMLVSE